MAHTFFTIFVPNRQDPREWARQMWDTYGFDYDTSRFGEHSVCAWADGASNDELIEALEEDDIDFDTFEVDDLDAFFGIDKDRWITG